MNILSTITGLLIAAVLNVPGTNQHEVAPVEEEPVVREAVDVEQSTLALKWFVYTGPSPDDDDYEDEITDASNYDEFHPTGPVTEPDCAGSEQICAVEVEEDGTSGQPDQTELENLLSNPSANPSRIKMKDIE